MDEVIEQPTMNSSPICPIDACTGCMACVNACPRQCIDMPARKDELGHRHPVIDLKLCIDCGLCKKVCHANHPVGLGAPLTAYAGWHRDTGEYHTSTSGGAATALSQQIIRSGGVVYGCASLPGIEIKHIRVDNLADLVQLKGSKYVQSDMGDCLKSVKKDLQQNLAVLFIGTPCQVAGLKRFLGKEFSNLYTVDLICHGTPSQAFLREHVHKVTRGKGVQVQFRKGNDMGLRIFDAGGTQIYYSNVWQQRYNDIYYNSFIDGYTYRKSCYRCQFARAERCSDITIGDFWGIGADLKHDSVNGLSCMLPITEKGNALLKSCDLELFERSVDEAVRGNGQLRHPSKQDNRRKVYRHLVSVIGPGPAYRLCELDHLIDKRFVSRLKRKLSK